MDDSKTLAYFRQHLLPAGQLSGLEAPVVDGHLALPVEVVWDGDRARSATFEVYRKGKPLEQVSRAVYRTLLVDPAFANLERLDLDAVACKDVPAVHLLGDPTPLLVREGLPRSVRRLGLAHPAMVTNAGDVGYEPVASLVPLHQLLASIEHLQIASCAKLGTLELPRLEKLELTADVTVKNLRELARANLPALQTLELACILYVEPEMRFNAVRALLRSKGMPALRALELAELDLDEDQWMELDEEGNDPEPWTPMLARSPLLRQLKRLTLAFRDIAREADALIEHAAAFEHLEALTLQWGEPIVRPTADAIAAAVA